VPDGRCALFVLAAGRPSLRSPWISPPRCIPVATEGACPVPRKVGRGPWSRRVAKPRRELLRARAPPRSAPASTPTCRRARPPLSMPRPRRSEGSSPGQRGRGQDLGSWPQRVPPPSCEREVSRRTQSLPLRRSRRRSSRPRPPPRASLPCDAERRRRVCFPWMTRSGSTASACFGCFLLRPACLLF